MADEGSVSYPRIRTAALAGALLVCLSACSNSHIRPGGRVSTADLRAGKLAVAVEACVTGVVTNYDQDLGTLVVQDRTGAFKFGEVPRPGARFGQQTEVCGETRPARIGMTLARPSVKALRDADLPVPRPTSPEEWSTGRVDWQWIEVEGLAHAVTADRFGVKTLHVLVQDRRVRVRIASTEGLQSVSNMVGARVRAIGIASQTSSHAGGEDFLLLSPGTRFVTEVSPAAPVATLAHALAIAPTGGTVVVRGGTYSKFKVDPSKKYLIKLGKEAAVLLGMINIFVNTPLISYNQLHK